LVRLDAADPARLEPGGVYPLPLRPSQVAVAPDGGEAFAVTVEDGAPYQTSTGQTRTGHTSTVVRIDLVGGSVHRFAQVPGAAPDLAVTSRHVYVPNAEGSEVWALNRRDGRLEMALAVGRYPTAVLAVRP
jgi:DNA-binding beta-propeller fold protein YncE